MCKWSDPFSKCVLIGRGLDHNSLETLKSQRKNVSSDYSVLKARPSENTRQSVIEMLYLASHMVGDNDGEVPPVPIPNTEVKLCRAEDSWLETTCENR